MKRQTKHNWIIITCSLIFSLMLVPQLTQAQKAKKNRARINADYVNILGVESYVKIKVSARVNRQTLAVSMAELEVYNEVNEEEVTLGTVKTDHNGEAKFIIQNLGNLKADSTGVYELGVSFGGNDAYNKASRSLSFKKATIKTNLITRDSINYISATLIDSKLDSPIVGEALGVRVKRMFKPLRIGEEFNVTDEEGAIEVAVEDGIPGLEGILTLEVVLNESDDYGTVVAQHEAPIGVAFIDESTFDDRTMWSPRNKTPVFMLIFPNLIIFGIWGFIVYLVYNLFRINKS